MKAVTMPLLWLLALPALAAGPRELPGAGAAFPAPLTRSAPAPTDEAARAVSGLQPVSAAAAAPASPLAAAPASADVTAEFVALHDAVGVGAAGPLFDGARQASYLLVGGFLSNHIHDYFGANLERLRRLGLRAERVPIHTEGRRQQALERIGGAVRAAPGPVVLLGHSRGGVLVHDWYRRASPELKAKVARLVVVQAPLRGTSYIEWFLASPWRRFKAAKLGPWVYGVNVLRGLFELTRPTRRWVAETLPPWGPHDLAKVVTIRTALEPGADRFYDKDRGRMAARGEPENDGRVSAESARIPGAQDVFLRGVNHQQLIVQRPDLRRRLSGYAPHPRFDAGDATEALVRLLFR